MDAPSHIDIDHVARLARLALSAEERADISRKLDDVLAHIEKLKQVDVSGVEPLAHAFPLNNVWREDAPGPMLSPVDALRNAPAQRDQMISVPKVVE